MKTVIIGGVAGGATAATRLRRLDEKMEIVILERGEFVSFANCGLPYYISGTIQDKDELTLQTPESFKDRYNIDVRVLNNAISINPDDKNVLVEDLRTNTKYLLPYDKLILSPGAKPVKPNIEGIDNRNVFTLRNIPDTIAIKNFIKENKPKNAVIIGGGYIGLEMMENLMSIGIKTSVVELSDHLIGGLDFDMAADVHRYLKQKGVKLYLKNAVRAINDNKAILNNCVINSDLIILSVGVKPETDIAKNCGIKVNQRGSILVNKNMETNIPDIYAVGDAIEVENFITKAPAFIPLAGPANKQGRIVSDNIAGLPSIYNGTQGTSILKIFDMTVATTGLNETSAKSAGINYDKTYIYSASHATYYPNATNMSIKVLWDKKTLKIIGAQIIGFDGVDKRIDVLATAIRLVQLSQT
ncbi:MAG: FAD-dependent oxidoreductase [Ruminococcus sp.]|nr:FAD-dependent oxidoreductase [Ruminococcus sp.]